MQQGIERGSPDGGTDAAAHSTSDDAASDPAGETVSPGELADSEGLRRLGDLRSLPELPSLRRYRQQTSRDRGTTDYSFPLTNFGNRDFNNFLCASEDAQLSPNQLAPFHFDQERCDEDYVHGAVIGRFEGAGRMVRMWIGAASLLNGPADDELLRIYVDDAPEPCVELPLASALDGSAGEMFAPPFGAGSARRLAWYYPVAFAHKLIVALDRLGDYDEYYSHCDVVYDGLLGHGGAQPATLTERRAAAAKLVAVDDRAVFPELTPSTAIALARGESRTVAVTGPATVEQLGVRVPEAQLAALADVRVSVRWDRASEPAIADLSLLELFAAVQAPPDRSTRALTSYSKDGEHVLALELPMPFEAAAELTFENRGTSDAAFTLSLHGERELPPAPFGELHVIAHEIVGPTNDFETVSADLHGRGRLAGVCAFLEGQPDPEASIQYDPLNMLEGDVRIRADGELALDGTGTEEYADDVFYFKDAPHANAFAAAWGVDDDVNRSPTGKASFCRWHVLGTEIDFERSLQISFELGGAHNPQTVISHHTVTYAYLEEEGEAGTGTFP